jgi:hypothetical protein
MTLIKRQKLGYGLVCPLYVGLIGKVEITFIFNRAGVLIFLGYSYGYTLDPNMGCIAPGGSAATYGYWMQSLLTFAHDFYNQAGWRQFSRLRDV